MLRLTKKHILPISDPINKYWNWLTDYVRLFRLNLKNLENL